MSFQAFITDLRFLDKEPGIYRNEMAVINTIYADAGTSEFGVWVYTPPIYDYTYRYLFYWQGDQRGYRPRERKDVDYYLIVEENKDHPEYPKGWRETVVKTSTTPVWTKVLPGNITIEKYTHE